MTEFMIFNKYAANLSQFVSNAQFYVPPTHASKDGMFYPVTLGLQDIWGIEEYAMGMGLCPQRGPGAELVRVSV